MNIGILGHGFIEWGGGLDFLRIICGSLLASDEPVQLHFLLPTSGPRLFLRRAGGRAWRSVKDAVGRPVTPARWPEASIVREFVQSSGLEGIETHEIDIGSGAIESAGRRLELDLVLPSVQPLNLASGLPWLGYIADFQHTYLPQFFSPEEIKARNRNFAAMLQKSSAVIVNARAVAEDIRRFAPTNKAKVIALPFGAAPNPAWFEWDNSPLKHYGIHGPYFIVCNQFWQHKDHITAYRAFSDVLRSYPELHLVCTGETNDFRNPDHFGALGLEARALGIESRLHVLGLIPKRDQIALLRASMALVQPTLFEGGPGGGAVFDAVALGVPAIVSDIPVNLEIAESGVTFFKASNREALAQAMSARLQAGPACLVDTNQLIAAGQFRRRQCGQMLLRTINQLRRNA